MPSLLDLVNRTLSELGKPATEVLNATPLAQTVALKLIELAPEILLDYNWNFAVAYVANYSPLTTSFSPDFVYSYELPGDYGKFFEFAFTGADWPIYAIWDGMLLANTLPVQYYYIRNDIPFEIWPSLVARALILYAACKLAPTATNNMKLAEYLYKEYEQARVKAILWNDQERSIQSTRYNDFNRITFV